MAYEKQTWATGDTITANKLNHMEDGIASGVLAVNLENPSEHTMVLDKTWQEIYDAPFTVCKMPMGDSVMVVPVYEINSGAGSYSVTFYDAGNTGDDQFFTLTTDSADGYPSYTI